MGVAIHVNSRPLTPPYTVLAIGNTQTLQADLLDTTHGQEWFNLVNQLGGDMRVLYGGQYDSHVLLPIPKK